MLFGFIVAVALVALFVAIAFSVSLLWVKIVCWLVVAAIVLFVLFCWWVNSTWGQEGGGR